MSPFGLGTRVVARVDGGDIAVGTIEQQHPDVWTIQLAEPVGADEFPPAAKLVISASDNGGLWVARSQLLRRSEGTLVITRPRVQERSDRRRDHRLEAAGTVAWSSRVGTGTATAVDVSRSGLKLQVGELLRVGDVVVVDVANAGRVSAMVVALTDAQIEANSTTASGSDARRFAHLAFLRADEETRAAIVAALAESADDRHEPASITIDLRASELIFGVSA